MLCMKIKRVNSEFSSQGKKFFFYYFTFVSIWGDRYTLNYYDHFMTHVNQIITLYTLNLYSVCVLNSVWLIGTTWTVARQAPLFMEFSRQEYWSGLSFPTAWDLPNPEFEPESPVLPALIGRVFTTEPPGKPCTVLYVNYLSITLEEMNKCQVYRANKKHLDRVYQEHLIIAGTTEEKERDGLKKNHNYVECHQFDALIVTEHLLYLRPCVSHREDPSNTHWTPPRTE